MFNLRYRTDVRSQLDISHNLHQNKGTARVAMFPRNLKFLMFY